MAALWHEVGECETGAAGPVPITWAELGAWQRLTGRDLTAWELRVLRKMSDEYVAESYAARDKKRAAPYVPKTAARISAARIKQIYSGAK